MLAKGTKKAHSVSVMRTAYNETNGIRINVTEHLMTKNLWEFYITDDKHSDDIVRALVMGYSTELGDISLAEIKPFVTMRTTDLNEILPPEGYVWEN